MYWTLELATKLEDAPWPATKEELIDCVLHEAIIEWDHIKSAWRYSEVDDIGIQDEDYNELYPLNDNDKEERNRS